MLSPSNPEVDEGSRHIEEVAKELLTAHPLITNKDQKPPSGDTRDFVSISPYHYKTEDGRYQYRDGERNPEADKYHDSENLTQAATIILTASLAAETAPNPEDKEKFARKATSTLQEWFINEDTRMTPSLEYAETKAGETTGNWHGIIEGGKLVYVIEGISHLKEEQLIDKSTLEGTERWFAQYLDWLQTSEKGAQAREAPNNQGTFYDVQVAYVADFLGREDIVRSTLEGAKARIASQIEPDGNMPLEAKRETPYDYQLYGIYAFSELAVLGEKYGIDLWNWQSENGRGLKIAFSYLEKVLDEAGDQPFKMARSGELYLAFRAASVAYNDLNYWSLPGKYYEDHFADELSARKFTEKAKSSSVISFI